MDKEQYTKLLHESRGTPFGVALSAFVLDNIDELKDVTNATSWDDALGRKAAIKILKDLFSFTLDKNTVSKKKNEYM